ncbi:hypothetical protein M3Y98_00452300 [Aphelenchoides besseyi]|nr:hypothetical protein M3Y98_00452300 [Aphelenchoides besseyi]KAI6207405.1 hypothetical protein M3Y96_00005600 [Aphelenchoides besseyi]
MVKPSDEEKSDSMPTFRKIKKKPKTLRTKAEEESSKQANEKKVEDVAANEEADEDAIGFRLSDIHEAQTTRKRRYGLTALECALGKKLASEFDELDDDPFRMRGGGMLQLSEDKKLLLAARDIEEGIKEQFRKETLLRDEHEEMKKFIDERLNQKKFSDANEKKAEFEAAEDVILFRAAEKLRGFKSKATEELLSNQMLVGIPEVDLGIDVRMKNVLETERKKAELLAKLKSETSTSRPYE